MTFPPPAVHLIHTHIAGPAADHSIWVAISLRASLGNASDELTFLNGGDHIPTVLMSMSYDGARRLHVEESRNLAGYPTSNLNENKSLNFGLNLKLQPTTNGTNTKNWFLEIAARFPVRHTPRDGSAVTIRDIPLNATMEIPDQTMVNLLNAIPAPA